MVDLDLKRTTLYAPGSDPHEVGLASAIPWLQSFGAEAFAIVMLTQTTTKKGAFLDVLSQPGIDATTIDNRKVITDTIAQLANGLTVSRV